MHTFPATRLGHEHVSRTSSRVTAGHATSRVSHIVTSAKINKNTQFQAKDLPAQQSSSGEISLNVSRAGTSPLLR
jgi:hypothetical protein